MSGYAGASPVLHGFAYGKYHGCNLIAHAIVNIICQLLTNESDIISCCKFRTVCCGEGWGIGSVRGCTDKDATITILTVTTYYQII
ncbi:hypothetical protein BGLA2_2010001 [Burkholderia gladioli]|nr:hypothetical protein BGLA2_2010001 [Burkholderia gladioli]